MKNGDIFATPSIGTLPMEIDSLVLSIYKASIAGIRELDRQQTARLKDLQITCEEAWNCASSSWEDEVQRLIGHTGNMALVSLLALFDHWLEVRGPKDRKTNFCELERKLGEGPLKFKALEDAVVARNSVVHHGGQPVYKYKGKQFIVLELFLDDEGTRVAVSESLLSDLSDKVRTQVEFWNGKKRALKTRP